MVQAACGTDVACEVCPVNLLVDGADRAVCGDAIRALTDAGAKHPTRAEAVQALGGVGISEQNPTIDRLTRATLAGTSIALSNLCNRRLVH